MFVRLLLPLTLPPERGAADEKRSNDIQRIGVSDSPQNGRVILEL